jgi:DNA-binding response OmpR family regulator
MNDPSTKPQVLVVEDEEALQRTMVDGLREANFEALSAYDGEHGLELAQERHPDLILLDIILPRRSGFEVLEALKADEGTRDIPVIVLTNLERISDVERMLSLGATNYLVKANYDVPDIVAKIREVLERRAEQQGRPLSRPVAAAGSGNDS